MIFPDANLLLYAEDAGSRHQKPARLWWDTALSGTTPVFLCWEVINALLRIGTNPRIHEFPLSVEEGTSRVTSWLVQPFVRIIHPLRNHWQYYAQILNEA